MLPTKFRVNWPFVSGEEEKNTFSTWRPSWVSDRDDSYQVSSQLAIDDYLNETPSKLKKNKLETENSFKIFVT